ncbi:MAG: lamin tail domain-containing protein [Candidatus Saccharimonadales bacterium]
MTGCAGLVPAQAETTAVPSLTISQLKITSSNGQFVMLYNSTNTTLDMSNYQLEYFNSFDLSKATSSKLISLTGKLPPHGYYMINDDSLLLCYQLTVSSVSLGFSSTAGFIEVLGLSQSAPGGGVTTNLQDYVGWSKSGAVGAQTLPTDASAFLQRDVTDKSSPMLPGGGGWQAVKPDPSNPCSIVAASSTNTVEELGGPSQLLPASEPPATIVAEAAANTIGPLLPPGDIGLMAPQITELLPNPSGTGNDSTDEFIELYNANDKPFDLTGFRLQTGLSTTHDYAFTAGTQLPAKSFTTFYSVTTKLTLSNSGSQATLLDPFGNSIATSQAYAAAADGQAWAYAKGKWYWSTQPTPGAANIIKAPPVKATKSTTVSSKKKTTATKPAAVKKQATAKPAYSGNFAQAALARVPIHPLALALVASVALLYALYEYRTDLGNYLRRRRQQLSAGSKYWSKFAWWRGDRTGQ